MAADHAHDVGLPLPVDGDAREAALLDGGDGVRGRGRVGSMTTSTRGTMTSRTVVSPRSKILSIISASWVVTSASPGSICSRAFSSSRETNGARVGLAAARPAA